MGLRRRFSSRAGADAVTTFRSECFGQSMRSCSTTVSGCGLAQGDSLVGAASVDLEELEGDDSMGR